MLLTGTPRLATLIPVMLAACFSACASEHSHSQIADDGWEPTVISPEFEAGAGPAVFVDAAHGNFHTIDGRFNAFAELLRLDGYKVNSADVAVSKELLSDAEIFVISNAVLGGHDAEWILPTPSAFTPTEIELLVGWVRGGGSLLLIADHMPFPGAVADLAAEFGVIFHNGFAMKSLESGGTASFTRSDGLLVDHPVTRGRSGEERVGSVRSFTGQAFRYVSAVQPLMLIPDEWIVLLPTEAWDHSEATPLISAKGLIQGGVLRYGAGRVAVFGEAAMFTAQSSINDGVVRRMGMNHPKANENAQFVLNVLHWLSGLLDDS